MLFYAEAKEDKEGIGERVSARKRGSSNLQGAILVIDSDEEDEEDDSDDSDDEEYEQDDNPVRKTWRKIPTRLVRRKRRTDGIIDDIENDEVKRNESEDNNDIRGNGMESDNEDIDLQMELNNETDEDIDIDNNNNSNNAGLAEPEPAVIDLTGGEENDADPIHNYITWNDIRVTGRIYNKYEEIFDWSEPNVQFVDKQIHKNNDDYEWLCTFDPPNCDKTCKAAKDLWKHIYTHIYRSNNIECEVGDCCKTYTSKTACIRHIRTKHMENQFPCTSCGKKHQNHAQRMRCSCKRQRR